MLVGEAGQAGDAMAWLVPSDVVSGHSRTYLTLTEVVGTIDEDEVHTCVSIALEEQTELEYLSAALEAASSYWQPLTQARASPLHSGSLCR